MSTTPQPQFLRRYELVIGPAPGANGPAQTISINSDDEPKALRISFDCYQVMQTVWQATISIYNLNEQTANLIVQQGNVSNALPAANSSDQAAPIQQGMPVTLSAGYYGQGANYGVIWEGNVIQVLWGREEQTTFKLTLNCLVNLDPSGLARNPFIYNSAIALTQRQVIEAMVGQCYHPIPTTTGSITKSLSANTLPRGKVMFGNPRKYLKEIARDQNLQYWLSSKGVLNMISLNTDVPSTPDVTVTPQTGIIGTPVQTQKGVQFRTLMNPNIFLRNPAMCVKIDNTQVVQQLQQVGVYPGILSQSGIYAVVAVRYTGDSRGQDWYTDVTGWLTGAEKQAATDILGAQLTSG